MSWNVFEVGQKQLKINSILSQSIVSEEHSDAFMHQNWSEATPKWEKDQNKDACQVTSSFEKEWQQE